MITDVLYSVNLYILFCVKRFELSHVYGHYAIEVLCIIYYNTGDDKHKTYAMHCAYSVSAAL